jgi:hypothetical protein
MVRILVNRTTVKCACVCVCLCLCLQHAQYNSWDTVLAFLVSSLKGAYRKHNTANAWPLVVFIAACNRMQ